MSTRAFRGWSNLSWHSQEPSSFFEKRPLISLNSQCRLVWIASKPQRASCLFLPRTSIPSTPHCHLPYPMCSGDQIQVLTLSVVALYQLSHHTSSANHAVRIAPFKAPLFLSPVFLFLKSIMVLLNPKTQSMVSLPEVFNPALTLLVHIQFHIHFKCLFCVKSFLNASDRLKFHPVRFY